jgi:hypothetical protein
VANGSAQAPTANSNQPASINAADIPQLLDCLIALLLPKRDAPLRKRSPLLIGDKFFVIVIGGVEGF